MRSPKTQSILYIPDHVRCNSSASLMKLRDQFQAIAMRNLPRYWIDQTCADRVDKMRTEILMIDAEIHVRKMRLKPNQRAFYDPRKDTRAR